MANLLRGRSVTVAGLNPLTVTDTATGEPVPDVIPVGMVPAVGTSGLLVIVDGRPWLWPAGAGEVGMTAAMREQLDVLREDVAEVGRAAQHDFSESTRDVIDSAHSAGIAAAGASGILVIGDTDPLPTTRRNGEPVEQGDLLYQVDVSGHIAGVLVYDGAAWIDYVLAAEHIIATGSISGPLIAADAIDGKTITGAVVRTAAGVERVEMDTERLARYRDDGEGGSVRTVNIGGGIGEADELALYAADGTLMSGFLADGSARVLGDLSVGGVIIGGEAVADTLARQPQGLKAIMRSSGDSNVAGSSELGYVRLDADVSADRYYRLSIGGIVAAATAGDRFRVWFKTWDGGAWLTLHMGQIVIPTGTGEYFYTQVEFRAPITANAAFYVTFQNATANRGVFWSGRSNYPVVAALHDLGPADSVALGAFDTWGGTPLSGGTNTSETGVATYKKTYPATWYRSWRGGSIVSDFLHHGYYGGLQRYSMVGFGGTLAADLSGATINKVRVLLDNESWWGSSGTVYVGSATNTSAPASPVTTGATANTAMAEGFIGYVNVGGFTTASRAITLGVGAGTGTGAYGKFRYGGVSLEVTYSK